MSSARENVSFEVEGCAVRGVLYRPPGAKKALPCVVLANGFSGTMDWILPAFAERFAEAGLAALIFDYRHLGLSEGTPRQLIDVKRQRADLRAAIAFARARPGIDPAKIALWGTSLGGSHAATVAAEDERIAAVVLTMPALDAIAGANVEAKRKRQAVSRGAVVTTSLRLLGAAIHDALRGAFGRSPRYLQVYGAAGEAFFTDPELASNFARLEQGSPSWQNRVAARFLLGVPRYQEGTMERIRAPIFVSLAEHDVEVSPEYVKAKVAGARSAEVRLYPAGHFELYHGAAFVKVAAEQAAFLRKNLIDRAAARPAAAPAEP